MGSIAPGADGNLWFTEYVPQQDGESLIGRITTAGSVTEFTDGLHLKGAGEIAPGPKGDAHMWLTETADI